MEGYLTVATDNSQSCLIAVGSENVVKMWPSLFLNLGLGTTDPDICQCLRWRLEPQAPLVIGRTGLAHRQAGTVTHRPGSHWE